MGSSASQALPELWWVTKVVIPLVGVLIASVIIPLLLHHLRFKREREERLFEARKEAYKDYFKKMESAVSDAGQEFERFSREVLPQAFRKLLDSNSSPESIVEFHETVGRIPLKIQAAYRKATEEVTSLQIICSEDLRQMTEQFESKNKELLDKSSAWLAELTKTMVNPDFEAPAAKEMEKIGEAIRELRRNIIRQMRTEIGSDTF